jgi:uncharacterized repeat protein (TIGR01451 family)
MTNLLAIQLKLVKRAAALLAGGALAAVLIQLGTATAVLAADQPPAAPPWTVAFKWQRCPTWYCETGWYASPAVADLDKDGQREVYWGGYTLLAVNGGDGTIRWARPQDSSERLWPGIVVADLDQDGSEEVVTASGDGQISVYGPGLLPVAPWPKDPTGSGNELRSLAVADLDADGDLEIAVCSTRSDNQWFVYEHTGAVRGGWPKMTDSDSNGYAAGCYNENVGLADVDGDGRGELIGPNDTHYVAAFNDDGSPLPANALYGLRGGQPKPWARVGLHVDHSVDLRGYADCGVEHRPNMANSAPTIADLDGDGTLEIVIVGNVYNCGTDPYTDLYEMPFVLRGDRTRWAAGPYDWTAIPTPDGQAAPLSEDYNLIENNVPNPVTADLDGDGELEILYPSYDGRLHAYWLDKSEHGDWPFAVYDGREDFYRFATEPVVVDLENDGRAEVIFGSWTQNGSGRPGKVYVVSWDGKLLQALDLPYDADDGRGGALAASTLANIDGDADLELVLGTINRGLVAYDIANSAGARVLWGTGRGSQVRSGLAPAAAPARGELSGSYKRAADLTPAVGAPITYTLRLLNSGPVLPTVRLTDTLPTAAALIPASVLASSGEVTLAGGQLRWAGAVDAAQGVTITYAMTVDDDAAAGALIANTAQIDDGTGSVLTRTTTVIVAGKRLHLPTIRR